MKKTLLIFFITLSALGQLLAFSSSTSTDSVGVSSNKSTDVAISLSEESALAIATHNLLIDKAETHPLDSANIASTVNPRTPKALTTNTHFPIPNVHLPITNDQLPTTNDQLLITINQLTNPNSTNVQPTNDQLLTPNVSFHPEGLIPASDPIDSAQYYIAKAQAVIAEIREKRKFIGYLDGESLQSLPVGIHKEIGGLDYDIAIASIKLKPQYAELEVYMTFTMPQNGKVLTFRGTGIKFTKAGAIVGDANLELVADYAINLQGDKSQIILKSGTQVSFDCSGFLAMAIEADVKFARSLLIPEGPQGDTLGGNVVGNFSTSITDWNNLIAEVSLPPFQLRSLKGVGFKVSNAVIDFSDLENALSMKFPDDYQSPAVMAGLPKLWRGFYLRELIVSLPSEFNKRGASERTQFFAENVLIDELGFSGVLTGTELLDKSNADMNGWAYSLDSLQIDVMANSIRSGSFSGDIVIPISGEERPFTYSALIQSGSDYVFNVAAPDSLEFPMFKTSKLELYPNSYVEVKVVDGKFSPKANLHGKMNIQAQLGNNENKKGVELADITFENLKLQAVKPYIQVGNFSFGSEAAQQAMANFPVSINNIGMKTISDTEVGLEFDLLLGLTGSGGGSYGAEAGLTIVGELPEGESIKKWKYKEVQVRDIAIDIDGGAYKFQGQLTFFKNDPMYGEGFNGQVQAEFKPGIKLQATAIFGNVEGYRYWYADALGSFSSGIPIFTGVGIYGFGGGAYYRMAMDTEGVGSVLGETVSGVVYVPKESAGLGLKATVELGSHPKPEAFNGDLTFEVAFNKGGGMRYISFKGNGYLATPPAAGTLAKMKEKTQKLASVVAKAEKVAGNIPGGALLAENAEADQSVTQLYGQIGAAAGEKGQISASVFISYDFNNKELHGNFEAYVNVAGGIIQGSGAGGRAGWAVLHFAPDEWYVYAGTPDDRIGLSMGIGSIKAETNSYLMVGTKIEGSPPPPENVANNLKEGVELDYMRDMNALENGGGFAFGSAFSIDTGDLTFLMFYASLSAGAGFDIMLKDYGMVTCKGSSDPLGVNGWYANGQAYAYFDGNIGIKVKLFGKNKKVDIIDLGAAAVLQAKLPNPFWMRGIVGGRFNVLGGLVKGDCQFEVTIGEECDMEGGNALEGVKVIADITPASGQKDVNVFNNPQVVFNMAVGEIFEMIDADDRKKTFRIKLDELKVLNGTTEIAGDLNWNATNDVVAFDSYDIFPSEKELTLSVKVRFEERLSGSWQTVRVDNKDYTEEKTVKFTTGIAPDYIPHENVEYSYPVVSQLNFYKDEYNQGYIKLDKGQPELFQVGDEWAQRARFTAAGGEEAYLNYNYSNSSRKVTFNLPASLSKDEVYKFELVNLPAQEAEAIDRNVSEKSDQVTMGSKKLDAEITTKTAEGTIDQLQEKQVFGMNFRSSKYATFSEKVDAQIAGEALVDVIIQWYAEYLLSYVNATENYDEAELEGNQFTNSIPLVSIEAEISNNPYFDNIIIPLVYNDYPVGGGTITHRDTDILGLIPIKAMNIYQINRSKRLNDDDLGGTYFSSAETWGYKFDMHLPMALDFFEIQEKVTNQYVGGSGYSDRIAQIIAGQFPLIGEGDYTIKINYRLPGQTTNHTTKRKTLKYNWSQ